MEEEKLKKKKKKWRGVVFSFFLGGDRRGINDGRCLFSADRKEHGVEHSTRREVANPSSLHLKPLRDYSLLTVNAAEQSGGLRYRANKRLIKTEKGREGGRKKTSSKC